MNKANTIRFLVVEKTSLKAPSYHMAKTNVFDTLAGAKRSCTAVNKKIAAKNKRDLYIAVLHAKSYAKASRKNAASTKDYVKRTKKEFVGDDRVYVVMDSEEFAKADEMVETYNMLNPHGDKVMIRKSQLGGCCDPATETYHSM